MKNKVLKIKFLCFTLILIQNLHTVYADTMFYNLAKRISSTVSGLYRKDENIVLPNEENDIDAKIAATDIMHEDGYASETHLVTTEDGYILTIYRIPGPLGSIPVFLQHGLLESSIDWLIPGKNKSLAYILSDHGYDVWLGNARGNTYSKKHKTLSTSDPKFWDFSWHELGFYDLPAVISYITKLKNKSLFYIGHSMGATTFSVMATEKPEITKKVKAMIGLAPATFVYHMKAPIKMIAPFWNQLQPISNAFGHYEIFPHNIVYDTFAEYVCKSTIFRNIFCSNSLFLLAGFSPEQLNSTLLPKIWNTFPAGTSVKLFIHWLQQIKTFKFRKFDYGQEINMKTYNSTEPPDYDFSKFQVPVAIFWSENDWLVGQKDVMQFYDQVPKKMGIYKVNDKNFNHFDFLWAIDAPHLIYTKVLNLMNKYNEILR